MHLILIGIKVCANRSKCESCACIHLVHPFDPIPHTAQLNFAVDVRQRTRPVHELKMDFIVN